MARSRRGVHLAIEHNVQRSFAWTGRMVHIETILQKVSSRILGKTVPKADRLKFVWRLPLRQNFPSLYAPESKAQKQKDVQHMLFALEPPDSALELKDKSYEAVFMHRPFDLHLRSFPNSYILWSHDDFDNNMTVGFNPALAADLQLLDPLQEVYWTNRKGTERRIGMVGSLDHTQSYGKYRRHVEQLFDGSDASKANGVPHITNVAVMGAFNPDLLQRMKSEHNIDLYITGQVRQAAMQVAKDLNIAVIAVGHQRCEAYGLRTLVTSIRQCSDESVKSEALTDLDIDILLSSKLSSA